MARSRKYRVVVVPEATARMVEEVLTQATRYEGAGMLVNPQNGRGLTGAEKATYAQAAGRMIYLLKTAQTKELTDGGE